MRLGVVIVANAISSDDLIDDLTNAEDAIRGCAQGVFDTFQGGGSILLKNSMKVLNFS